jgi:fumarate hydratase subunit beta
MGIKKLTIPFSAADIKKLKAGDELLISGEILTARDQAHLLISRLIKKKKELPFGLAGKVIYYCGPTPAEDGIIGSCGPTTSGRMDEFTPDILAKGVRALIGKGARSEEVRVALKRHKAVYFAAPAGCGAFLKKKVLSCRVIAFPGLGPEAVYRLEVKGFPVIVAIDSRGKDLYARFAKKDVKQKDKR